jgi:hypothetical protein
MYAGLTLAGAVNSKYRIDYLTAFGATNHWQTLTNVTLSSSPSLYFDLNSPTHPNSFYRAVLLPP